jgi:hypothetical protein
VGGTERFLDMLANGSNEAVADAVKAAVLAASTILRSMCVAAGKSCSSARSI